ncbi:unnamed protein product [Amoebophrya sp. A25]|nr:unnamed protein product [Amoebophrya sp. A25]|eukprot:GSA25T00023229001.1
MLAALNFYDILLMAVLEVAADGWLENMEALRCSFSSFGGTSAAASLIMRALPASAKDTKKLRTLPKEILDTLILEAVARTNEIQDMLVSWTADDEKVAIMGKVLFDTTQNSESVFYGNTSLQELLTTRTKSTYDGETGKVYAYAGDTDGSDSLSQRLSKFCKK